MARLNRTKLRAQKAEYDNTSEGMERKLEAIREYHKEMKRLDEEVA